MLLLAGSVIISLVIADRMVVGPWQEYNKKLSVSIAELEERATGQEMLIKRKATVEKQVTAYQEYLKEGRSPEMEMADFLKEIENMGRTSAVALPEMRPLVTIASEHSQEYGVEVHFEGRLQDWLRFVYRVEVSPSLFVIEKAVVGRGDQGTALLKGFLHIRKLVLKRAVVQTS